MSEFIEHSDNQLLIEPLKVYLNTATNAASQLLAGKNPVTDLIEISENYNNNILTLKMTYKTKHLFVRSWEINDESELDSARAVLYGSLLTELIATYAIVSSKAMEHLKGTS